MQIPYAPVLGVQIVVLVLVFVMILAVIIKIVIENAVHLHAGVFVNIVNIQVNLLVMMIAVVIPGAIMVHQNARVLDGIVITQRKIVMMMMGVGPMAQDVKKEIIIVMKMLL